LRSGNRLLHVHRALPFSNMVEGMANNLSSDPTVANTAAAAVAAANLPAMVGENGWPSAPARQPSRLYGASAWRLGLAAARFLPDSPAEAAARSLAGLYARIASRRFDVVTQNLLPACNGDRNRAQSAAASLFRNFGTKLLDLWRFEAGLDIKNLFPALHGREHYDAALKTGRGVLLVTPHLGNWEFGAPLLTMNGYKLHVITLAEPGQGLTEMRQAARARWGIETVVIGRDPFAFVDVIRRLEAGATIALLVDRPPATSAVDVQLFGKPFAASIAVAELARATGCELLPVYLVREQEGYAARILPRVDYERASLRARECRQQLTQQLIDVFAPVIREHIDQWYHFVPVWK
jgi:KDO2-lipid IV(A) lauroyltransferase